MKKFIFTFLIVVMLFSFVGCTSNNTTNVTDNSSSLVAVPGRNNLFYDSGTGIVYFMYSKSDYNSGYGYMSPYYAPNGYPYKYDNATGSLVEIDVGCNCKEGQNE